MSSVGSNSDSEDRILPASDLKTLTRLSLLPENFAEAPEDHETWKQALKARFGVSDPSTMTKKDYLERHLWRRFDRDPTLACFSEENGFAKNGHKAETHWGALVAPFQLHGGEDEDRLMSVVPTDDCLVVLTERALHGISYEKGAKIWKFEFSKDEILADLHATHLGVSTTNDIAFVCLSAGGGGEEEWEGEESESEEDGQSEQQGNICGVVVAFDLLSAGHGEPPAILRQFSFGSPKDNILDLFVLDTDPSFPDSVMLYTCSNEQSTLYLLDQFIFPGESSDDDESEGEGEENQQKEEKEPNSHLKVLTIPRTSSTLKQKQGASSSAQEEDQEEGEEDSGIWPTISVDLGVAYICDETLIHRVDIRSWTLTSSRSVSFPIELSMITETSIFGVLNLQDESNNRVALTKFDKPTAAAEAVESDSKPVWSVIFEASTNEAPLAIPTELSESKFGAHPAPKGVFGPVIFILAHPILNLVAAVTFDHVACFEAESGELKWVAELPQSALHEISEMDPWEAQFWENTYAKISQDNVYVFRTAVSDEDRFLYRLDVFNITTGEWISDFHTKDNQAVTRQSTEGGLVIRDGVVYLHDSGFVHAVKTKPRPVVSKRPQQPRAVAAKR